MLLRLRHFRLKLSVPCLGPRSPRGPPLPRPPPHPPRRLLLLLRPKEAVVQLQPSLWPLAHQVKRVYRRKRPFLRLTLLLLLPRKHPLAWPLRMWAKPPRSHRPLRYQRRALRRMRPPCEQEQEHLPQWLLRLQRRR